MANGNGNQITRNGSKGKAREAKAAAKLEAERAARAKAEQEAKEAKEKEEAKAREAAFKEETKDRSIAESGANRIKLVDIEVDPMINVSRYYLDIEQAIAMREKEWETDDFKALANTIGRQGMLAPLIVEVNPNIGKTNARPGVENPGAKYRLRIGFRRQHAAVVLKWDTVPAKVQEGSERALDELNHVENALRKNVTPFQLAAGMLNHKTKYNLTDKEIGNVWGKSESYVSNLMRCARELHPRILRAWSERDPDGKHPNAKAEYLATWTDLLNGYVKIKDPTAQLGEFQKEIHIANGHTPKEAEELVLKDGFTLDKEKSNKPQTDKVKPASKDILKRAQSWFRSKEVRETQGEVADLAVAVLDFVLGEAANIRVGRDVYFDPRIEKLGGEAPKN